MYLGLIDRGVGWDIFLKNIMEYIFSSVHFLASLHAFVMHGRWYKGSDKYINRKCKQNAHSMQTNVNMALVGNVNSNNAPYTTREGTITPSILVPPIPHV